ncbi:DUF4396 domain-containing protein [Streptomyces sp. NPDC049879]|uniref:DUF4396 domain-containing protein n=1 Tax=Streptomyces sp. NPDC049879 TaxID=3365598 RepID=UPI0037BD5F48
MRTPPDWLVALSWVSLGVAFACAGWILYDTYGRGCRQPMRVMEAVWPVTALYFGPIAVAAYRAFGRPGATRRPRWASTALGVSHCGAGCTLGDVIAGFAVFAVGAEIAGHSLFAEYAGDFTLALLLGIAFQYFAIAPMRGLSPRAGLVAAAKADVLSLTAFEIGLFAWMAVQYFVIFPAPDHIAPDSPVYWAGMQLGMIAGFCTSWPVNVWLIRRGIKEAM